MKAGSPDDARQPSIGFFYLVAVSLGISFLVSLLFLAWDRAVEKEAREFAYQALTVNDAVTGRMRTANVALESIASLYRDMPQIDDGAFGGFARDLLARHEFVFAVGYYRRADDTDGAYRLLYGNTKTASGIRLPEVMDASRDDEGGVAIAGALRAEAVVPVTAPAEGLPFGGFALLRRIGAVAMPGASPEPPAGLVVLIIESASLVGSHTTDPNLSIELYSQAQDVGGRKLLYRQAILQPGAARAIDLLHHGKVLRFENYSMQLTVAKALYWTDLERAPMFAAVVVGVGVTLLLVALARAKDLQARELKERNTVIEEQVRWQTQELAKARDEALQASRVKSEFLASMSHEIRTPLNAIIGMAELLGETPMSADQQKYVGVFRNAGEALLALVNDILDLSKIEARQLVLEHIDLSMREVIEHAVDIYALKTDAKGVELVAHIDPEVPVLVRGDPGRLRQIVLNLIGNATKFTERGEIAVTARRVPAVTAQVRLRVSVADTGIGIPPDKLESIFASFTQVDSSTTRKYGGTGLGLTISRELVELMGGRIWVESVEGEGSTFHFEADFEAVAAPAGQSQTVPAALVTDMPVLVIDDNDTNRLILREMLVAEGAQVEEAASGREGIDRYAQRRARGQPFRLVLCDVRMPGMDGFMVAQEIADAGGDAAMLLMLSSSQLAGALDLAKKAGIHHYLVKPVKRADLFSAIRQVIAPVAAPAPRRAVPRAPAAGHAILLVEDNADNRMLIKAYLKREAFVISEAGNGAEALEKFTSGRYDIVLMDVQMPVMDGREATRAIRVWEAEHGRAATPIIALTAHAIKEEMDKSLEAGCTAHLTKPIKKETLLAALAAHLS